MFLFDGQQFTYTVWNRTKLTWDSFDTVRTQAQACESQRPALDFLVEVRGGNARPRLVNPGNF